MSCRCCHFCDSKYLPLLQLQSPSANPWKDPALDKLSVFCEERRSVYDWVPTITLPERWSDTPLKLLHMIMMMMKRKSRSWASAGGPHAFLPHMSGLRGCGCNSPLLQEHTLPVHPGWARWFWITLCKGSDLMCELVQVYVEWTERLMDTENGAGLYCIVP